MWITTVGGLDWPKTQDPIQQRLSLLEIINRLEAAHFNTIYFQIRGRGDVMYRSPFEPWSEQLTGSLGRDPGWDPLSFVIQEAHRRGMEVHAWFNTFLLKNGRQKPSESKPRHLLLGHPDWAHLIEGDWWLDPGMPSVRDFLFEVGMDIVRRYDIDGFHFDFMRYPGKVFPDEAAYKRYGKGLSRDDWRRENINQFVRRFYESATSIKPMLKIGATPIGIYLNVTKNGGWQSYSDLFQDSRSWLRDKKLDYLVPQVYWALGDRPGNPDFAVLAKDWAKNSFSRHIYVGIGAYKPEVRGQLPVLIDSSRCAGARGNAFFRYENIVDVMAMGMRYRYPANIPSMPWKDSLPPNSPGNLVVANVSDGIFKLQWESPRQASDGDTARHYNIYRASQRPIDTHDPENLLFVTPTALTHYTDTIVRPAETRYYYAVSALDKGNNESVPTAEAAVMMPELAALSRRYALGFTLGEQYSGATSNMVFIPYEISRTAPVLMKILDASNNEVVNVVDAVQEPGRYVAAASVSRLKNGVYTCLLVAGEYSSKKAFRVGK